MDPKRYATYREHKWKIEKTSHLPKYDGAVPKLLGTMGSEFVEDYLDKGGDINRFLLVDVEQDAAEVTPPPKGGFWGGDCGLLTEDWRGHKAGTLILIIYVDGTFGGEPGARSVNEYTVAVEI